MIIGQMMPSSEKGDDDEEEQEQHRRGSGSKSITSIAADPDPSASEDQDHFAENGGDVEETEPGVRASLKAALMAERQKRALEKKTERSEQLVLDPVTEEGDHDHLQAAQQSLSEEEEAQLADMDLDIVTQMLEDTIDYST